MAPLKGYCSVPASKRCTRKPPPTKPRLPMSPERARFWRIAERTTGRPGQGLRGADGYAAQRARLRVDAQPGYKAQTEHISPGGAVCEERPLPRDEALERVSQRLTFHILDQWKELAQVVESHELRLKVKRKNARWVREQTREHANINARSLKPSDAYVTVAANARAAEEFILRSVQRLSRRFPRAPEGIGRGLMEEFFLDASTEADDRLVKEKDRAVSYYEQVMNAPEAWKRWPSFWEPSSFRGDEGEE